jgi:hypothetical protein
LQKGTKPRTGKIKGILPVNDTCAGEKPYTLSAGFVLVVAVEFFILTIFPGRMDAPLAGIPLNTTAGYALFFLAVMGFVIFALLRSGVSEPIVIRHAPAAKAAGFFRRNNPVMFTGALALKTILFASSFLYPPALFDVCYFMDARPAQCFYSPDNPFKLNNATLLSPTTDIRFEGLYQGEVYPEAKEFTGSVEGARGNWYLNNSFYNGNNTYYKVDKRYVKPGDDKNVSIRISGRFPAPPSGDIRALYTGTPALTISGVVVALPEAPGGTAAFQIKVPPGIQTFTISYGLGRGAHLALEYRRPDSPDAWKPLEAVPAKPVLLYVLQGAVVVLYIAFLCALIAVFAYALKPSPYLFLIIPIGALILKIPEHYVFSLILTVAYLGSLHEKRSRGRVDYLIWITMIAVCAFIFILHKYDLRDILIRLPYDDPMAYDTGGRCILDEVSLRTCNSVFIMQPGVMYYMSAALLLFGESNILALHFNLCLFFIIFWLFMKWVEERGGATRYSAAAVTLAMALFGKTGFEVIRFNLSEYLSWTLMLAGIMLLFGRIKVDASPALKYPLKLSLAAYMGAVMLASAAVTRPNQLPGQFAILCLWAAIYSRSFQGGHSMTFVIKVFAAFTAVVSLPLIHNLYYGHEFLLFSKGLKEDPTTLVLSPLKLLRIFSSPDVRAALWYQASHMFVLVKWLRGEFSITYLLFNAAALFYAAASVRAWLNGHWRAALVSLAVLSAFAAYMCSISWITITHGI